MPEGDLNGDRFLICIAVAGSVGLTAPESQGAEQEAVRDLELTAFQAKLFG
jgi:hypothetical protein